MRHLCTCTVVGLCTLLLHLYGAAAQAAAPGESAMEPLTPEEARVILHKGTEAPYSGALLNNKGTGTYVCRQCGAALYRSDDKFDSGCGWPSFDDALPGAVLRKPDADGRRTEILCAQCGGHLGHVFEGEALTPKNTRHCVNSVSMRFVPAADTPADTPANQPADTPANLPADTPANQPTNTPANQPADTPANAPAAAHAYFAGGCFWGVEDAFSKVPGVLDAVSGYMGGSTAHPTYEAVSSGRTGHAETVRVTYAPDKVSFETLARLFFEIHDPTQKDRQGPDVGTQYRSAIFYADAQQKEMAEHLVGLLRAKGWDVVTELRPAALFTPAEEYHQDFTQRTGRGACHIRVPRFTSKAGAR